MLARLLSLRHLDLHPDKPVFDVPKPDITKADNILIYGDYDADGLTSTAILWMALHQAGYQVVPFIPNRQVDGYGFKADSFFRLQAEKGISFDTIITIDNGIVAQKEFQLVPRVKVIVIDHHLPNKDYPAVHQIIHSTDLSAAGLAYFVSRHFIPNPDLGLAALGTVTDCLPLTGVNRGIVYHGLRDISHHPSPGIDHLITSNKIDREQISSYHLGYVLGPRLNAIGRLSDPTDALRLLCSPDQTTAARYGHRLNQYNQERQLLQEDHFAQAQKDLVKLPHLLFVVGDYNPGIIGLIASRLTEKYYLPSVVISTQDTIAKGSCRSIKEINIIDSLRQCSELFIDLGGHPGAAGFSILPDNIPRLQDNLAKIIDADVSDQIFTASIEVDAPMSLPAATIDNATIISQLQPFGIGNPQPLFLFSKLTIVSKRLLGSSNDHLKLRLRDENLDIDAIAFKKSYLNDQLSVGDMVDIVVHLDVNTYNGHSAPQLVVKEIIKI